MPANEILGSIFGILFILFIFLRAKRTYKENTPNQPFEESGKDIKSRISSASTSEELISMLIHEFDEGENLLDEENDLALEKASHLGLSKYGWAYLYRVAERDTALERIALAKSKNLL